MVQISHLWPLALGMFLNLADGAFMASGTGSTLTNWDWYAASLFTRWRKSTHLSRS